MAVENGQVPTIANYVQQVALDMPAGVAFAGQQVAAPSIEATGAEGIADDSRILAAYDDACHFAPPFGSSRNQQNRSRGQWM